MRRYLALWFPYLPSDRLARSGPVRIGFGAAESSHQPAPPPGAGQGSGEAKHRRTGRAGWCGNTNIRIEGALALTERHKGAVRLMACNPDAVALGLTAGMTLADARARVPDLAAVESDPGADMAWLERIADACDRFTPGVMTEPPDGLVLDITGCAHLFGGEYGLLDEVEARMRRWTGHLRHALADTPEGARALARFQTAPSPSEAAALRRLPVAALELDAEPERALRRAGLKTIGDLADRPLEPLAARFGVELPDRLNRLLGREGSRIVPRRAPPALLFERRFAEPIARADDALLVIGELASDAGREMEERRKGGRRFVARLFRTDGHVIDLAVECGGPLRDPDRIMRLFTERVSALSDPIDPGFGFDMIRLAVPKVEPLAAAQLHLEGGNVAACEAIGELVDRLSMRAGPRKIRRFTPRDTHVPEQAVLALPAIEAPAPVAWDTPDPDEPPHRPIHLFDPPQPVEVIAQLPDGPPRRFRWRRSLHEVSRFEGPERIGAEWWRRSPGDPGLTRDYYRVEDVRGRRFWLFRHGLYDEKPAPRWYVHGLFA